MSRGAALQGLAQPVPIAPLCERPVAFRYVAGRTRGGQIADAVRPAETHRQDMIHVVIGAESFVAVGAATMKAGEQPLNIFGSHREVGDLAQTRATTAHRLPCSLWVPLDPVACVLRVDGFPGGEPLADYLEVVEPILRVVRPVLFRVILTPFLVVVAVIRGVLLPPFAVVRDCEHLFAGVTAQSETITRRESLLAVRAGGIRRFLERVAIAAEARIMRRAQAPSALRPDDVEAVDNGTGRLVHSHSLASPSGWLGPGRCATIWFGAVSILLELA